MNEAACNSPTPRSDKVDEISREIRAQTWKLMTLMVAVVGTVVAALRL